MYEPRKGTIFTTVVNLELSDEQRGNTDAEDILRETNEIFDSYSTEKRRGKCINSRCSPRRSESVRRGVKSLDVIYSELPHRTIAAGLMYFSST